MKNKESRRQFLRNTSLAALSLGILPTIAKNTEPLKPNSPVLCDESTVDYYGEGPFYTANAPSIQNDILEVIWEPNYNLPNGHYFIALKINDLQVHYIKVIRQK